MKIILLRHGESQWNLENRFTGWTDVKLTSLGKIEAEYSGKQILKKNIKVDVIYSSILKRSVDTARIVANVINFPPSKIIKHWRLNERHYGKLQGLNKSETAKRYGEEQVHLWRRSFDIPPPLVNENDKHHPQNNSIFKSLRNKKLPAGESLKDVICRINPFWSNFSNKLSNEKNYLIVAHSNSLRAIVKIIENLSSEKIVDVEIPTGVPLVYDFDNNFNFTTKNFLIDNNLLKTKQELIKNQGKAE